MLKKQKQHKYLAKRWRAIRSYLYDFANTPNLEVLHKLRVEVKKLKAFAGFASAGGHGKDADRAIKPVKKMFRVAGEIREAGLTLSMLQKYQITHPRLKSATIHTLNEKTATFQSHIDTYLQQIKKSDRKLRASLHSIRNRNIEAWFSEELTATAALLAAPPPERLHDARKKLKTLLYTYTMLPKPLAARVQVNKDYLHRLQELIGNWHDAALAADLLAKGNNVRSGGRTARNGDKQTQQQPKANQANRLADEASRNIRHNNHDHGAHTQSKPVKTRQQQKVNRLSNEQKSLIKQTLAAAAGFSQKALSGEGSPR
ncbi:CHAD domain-containing protein [Chitinophaga lutea]|uniref:CHAD domain-containing protein n=1 Tax=Chitinophaga lutea TaxID=2488634 RepID=A0A3N4QE67_9BACT|nr:CHAD domain-containing protein [Chitinophaga lutea]RPE14250.1 CHAD domain-containing protein [Chitinophaga lutea]